MAILKKPCACPGCPMLVPSGQARCEEHAKEIMQEYDKDRPSANRRGYNADWQRARLMYLREHPLCVECEREGRLTPATIVDHVKDHKGDRGLFWDRNNWQALCKSHHDSKTAKEHGVFRMG